MAQAKGKNKKKAAKGPEAMVLMYGFSDEERVAQARDIFKSFKVRTRVIDTERLMDPVGLHAGLVGYRRALKQPQGEVPFEELMVFCNIPDEDVDPILFALDAVDLDVPRKAMLTKTNKSWPFALLVKAIEKEVAMYAEEFGTEEESEVEAEPEAEEHDHDHDCGCGHDHDCDCGHDHDCDCGHDHESEACEATEEA